MSQLPIWIAGYGPKALQLTGEIADGFVLQLADPEITAWSIAAVRRAAEEAGRDPDAITICVAAPAYVSDGDLAHARDQCRWFGGMVGNHVAEIVSRYGADGAAVPPALTDYIAGREGYDYNEHGRAGTRTRSSCPTRSSTASASSARRRRRSRGSSELAGLGVDQFALYLQHDDKDGTLAAYGDARHPGRERARGRADVRSDHAARGTCAAARTSSQAGRRAWHVRRPWRSRLTWSSSSAPGGVSASIASCSSSNGRALAEAAPSRAPTRETCVSTGTSRMPKANSRTQAAVLRPTPGSAHRKSRASSTPASAQPVERELAVARRCASQDRLDAHRLHLRDPARAGSPPRPPRPARRARASQVGEALAQAQVGDVAVAVVRRLRQDGADELGDRMAVRRHARDAVDLGEPGADAPHAGGWGRAQEAGPRQDTGATIVRAADAPMPSTPSSSTTSPCSSCGPATTTSPCSTSTACRPAPTTGCRSSREGGGIAVDLPGFGRTGKRGDGDFTADGWARWLPRFLDAVGVDRVRICAHDWGAAGLLWARASRGASSASPC